MGLYYESRNEIGKAIDIYHNGDWKNSGDFLFRLLLCNMVLGKYDEAFQVYDSAYEISKTAQSTGIWLSAVKQQSINKYYMAIREKTEMFKHNVEDIFYIMLSVDNSNTCIGIWLSIHKDVAVESITFNSLCKTSK